MLFKSFAVFAALVLCFLLAIAATVVLVVAALTAAPNAALAADVFNARFRDVVVRRYHFLLFPPVD